MRFSCCPNLMFLAFPWMEIHRFSNRHFVDYWQFDIDSNFANVEQVKTSIFKMATFFGSITKSSI